MHVDILQGMYVLPQSGLISQQLIEKRMNKQGYQQREITLGFWTHDWRLICLSLCVDDFGIKYVGKQHAGHLMTVLREHYKISRDWKGKKCLGLDIDWDYNNRKVHLSMLGYVAEALSRFRHKQPCKPQYQLYPHIKPNYGAKSQYAEATNESPPLSKEHKNCPGSHCYPIVLFKGSGSNHDYFTWIHCGTARQPNEANDIKSKAIIRLCGLIYRCRPHIPSQ